MQAPRKLTLPLSPASTPHPLPSLRPLRASAHTIPSAWDVCFNPSTLHPTHLSSLRGSLEVRACPQILPLPIHPPPPRRIRWPHHISRFPVCGRVILCLLTDWCLSPNGIPCPSVMAGPINTVCSNKREAREVDLEALLINAKDPDSFYLPKDCRRKVPSGATRAVGLPYRGSRNSRIH